MSRSVQWARRLAAIAVALALAVPALAGTTGKLSGRVVNEKKEPLPGVNIRIEGQRLGAITDDQGEYFIIGIPVPARYSVHMNLIGYADYTVENVADHARLLDHARRRAEDRGGADVRGRGQRRAAAAAAGRHRYDALPQRRRHPEAADARLP